MTPCRGRERAAMDASRLGGINRSLYGDVCVARFVKTSRLATSDPDC